MEQATSRNANVDNETQVIGRSVGAPRAGAPDVVYFDPEAKVNQALPARAHRIPRPDARHTAQTAEGGLRATHSARQ